MITSDPRIDISHSILSISTPGSTVFPGDREKSVALARLLNEWQGALVQTYPRQFSFVAVITLPYTQEAVVEVTHSLFKLGAVGIVLLSNHEVYYLGHSNFRPFYEALNELSNESHTIFIHPTTPYLRYNAQLVEANPTNYAPGLVEFYFDTARTLMDLFVSGTMQNYTNIRYQISHVGDSFLSIIDRFLSTTADGKTSPFYTILQTRFWWDSAGPTYPHQVRGLLAYEVPKSRLTFGTDYPYGYNYETSLEATLNSSFLDRDDLAWLFEDSAKSIYQI
ncbi:hypothetical protein DSL72_001897 [Monilinia vaccinii-corymbosi]|uniref:Amidohydrolase-related domain-containing protein n=1 Tax=Monilinia vaccinii-corymbosi TaxID=61207 RepID=A0A8A3PB45_9HELO|nr:hypothetical protein DSL72_001897 [Monilinia vaccinii-corymbosi]